MSISHLEKIDFPRQDPNPLPNPTPPPRSAAATGRSSSIQVIGSVSQSRQQRRQGPWQEVSSARHWLLKRESDVRASADSLSRAFAAVTTVLVTLVSLCTDMRVVVSVPDLSMF